VQHRGVRQEGLGKATLLGPGAAGHRSDNMGDRRRINGRVMPGARSTTARTGSLSAG
jgi:hypothetical protein